MEQLMYNRMPVHELKLGCVRALIWENEEPDGPRYEVSVARLSKDGDKARRSEYFGRDDLPLVAEIVDLAHLWIFEQAELIA